MNRLRLSLTPGKGEDASAQTGARDVFRRFFDLIERFERPLRPREERPAPEVKARITRLGDDLSRKS